MKLSGLIHKVSPYTHSKISQLHYRKKLEGVTLESEPELLIIPELVKPGATVFDIGANFGLHTRFMSEAVGDTGQVHSFEPTITMYDVLSNNVESLNLDNVATNQLALSDQDSELEFFVPIRKDGSPNYYESSLVEPEDIDSADYMTYIVDTTTLDSYCEKNQIEKVDYLKIDVEGHEIAVLKGAEKLLRTSKPAIFLEVNEPLDDGAHGTAVKDLVHSLDYEVHTFDGREITPWHARYDDVNFLLLPRDSSLELPR